MKFEPPNGFMLKTTLLMITFSLALSAEGKLTDADKLALARAEAAAAKAGAELTGFANYANSEVRKREEAVKQKNDALAALVSELKKKAGIAEACIFDENQDPKLRVDTKQPDGTVKITLTECPAPEEVKK